MGQKKPAPVVRTQAQRRAESEEKLLDAAREVLAQKGLVGMTLAEVGKRAGVSRGLAAHYFGNKEGLVQALAQRVSQNLDVLMRSAPDAAPGLASVLRFVDLYLGRKDRKWTNTRTILLLIAESLTLSSESAPFVASYEKQRFQYLEDNIRAGIDAGEIRPDLSPQVGVEIVVGALRGVMLQRLVESSVVDVSDLRQQMLIFVERALVADKK